MTMTKFASKAKEKIRVVLDKMLDQHYLGSKDNDVIVLKLDGFPDDMNLSNAELMGALIHLKEKTVIEAITTPFEKAFEDEEALNTYYVSVPSNFRTLAEEYLNELLLDKGTKQGLILYLDKAGNFWHGDKSKTCYPMGITGGRFAIVKYLAENDGLQHTQTIASVLGGKGVRSVMSEIGKIRAEIKHRLKLPDVIKNEKPLGYRIDPKYRIVITD